MVKGKISGISRCPLAFSLPVLIQRCILPPVYRLRKAFPLGAAALAALAFLSGYEIATLTGVRENSVSLHTEKATSTANCLDEALTESAESNRAETLGTSLAPGFAVRLPHFVAAHGCLVSEIYHNHQNLPSHPVNPRAPPAL